MFGKLYAGIYLTVALRQALVRRNPHRHRASLKHETAADSDVRQGNVPQEMCHIVRE